MDADVAVNDYIPIPTRRISRFMRWMRAVWRYSSALWNEFRVPIVVFVVATVAGGWLYGELLVIAGYSRIPFHDLPYLMVALMVVESVTELPPEPYLIMFWYVMPLIGIFIVGRGITDFVRLFFDRGENRAEWEAALASTYRNHIIVIGAGHVGIRVIRALVSMGFEVIALDVQERHDLDEEFGKLRVRLLVGDGRDPRVLDQAGLKNAQALIVCTSEDFVNLEVSVRAREINDRIRIVVRMWDDQFAAHLKRSLNAETVSASDLAAPAFAGAALGMDIASTLHVQESEYSLIRLQVQLGSFMDGRTVDEVQEDEDVDIVLLERGDDVNVHPSGELRVMAGDTLVIFARQNKLIELSTRNRRNLMRDA